jgi:hypothetical protein
MKLLTEHTGSLLHATSIAWTNSCGGCIFIVPSLIVVRLAGDDTAIMTFPVVFIYFQNMIIIGCTILSSKLIMLINILLFYMQPEKRGRFMEKALTCKTWFGYPTTLRFLFVLSLTVLLPG